VAIRRTKTDKRLLGTWKSDKRRTFKDFVPRPGVRGEKLDRFKALFGKLKVTFTRRKIHSDYEGSLHSVDYEVLGSDAESVAIACWDTVAEDRRIQHIHFEGKHYWISLGGMREFFRRID